MTNTIYQFFCSQDEDLAIIHKQFGEPPNWQRVPGFTTLIHIILEQQVSLASAKAAFAKLQNHIAVTPENILRLDDIRLKTLGFSRQKTRYAKELAKAIIDGRLELDTLHLKDDQTIRREFIKLPGIGNWTIDIYLLMALNRPDILPVGDLALRIAVKEIKGLKAQPTFEELEFISQPWRPYRSYATKLLWHYYLSR
jgi:DNA-3-methyladenine glycosylase II